MPGMAYDEGLAIRLLGIVGDEAGLAEKKMFGGLAVLLGGNMAVGVYGDDLLVRTDPGQQDMLLAEPGTRPLQRAQADEGLDRGPPRWPRTTTCGAGWHVACARPRLAKLRGASTHAGAALPRNPNAPA